MDTESSMLSENRTRQHQFVPGFGLSVLFTQECINPPLSIGRSWFRMFLESDILNGIKSYVK